MWLFLITYIAFILLQTVLFISKIFYNIYTSQIFFPSVAPILLKRIESRRDSASVFCSNVSWRGESVLRIRSKGFCHPLVDPPLE